ncbi:MAG: SH3 domain-containing protein [Chloroflexota bacterium]
MPDEEFASSLIPSPDGTQFLIPTFPSIVSEAFTVFGSFGDVQYSPNIWLCDTTTDSLERIISQEGGDEPFDDELPPIDIVRGQIVWSPDGSQLAWTELSFEDDTQSVVKLDLETGDEADFIIDVPLAPFPAPAEVVAWVDEGLVLWVSEFDEETFFNIETLTLVDMDSESIIASYEILNGGESDDFYTQRELVLTPDGAKYALDFEQAGWVLIDVTTGESEPLSGHLAMANPMNPDSLEVQYEIDFEFNYNWQVTNSDTMADEFFAYPPQRIALSPDGTQIAYADSTLHILNSDGSEIDVSNSDGFADDFAATIIWGQDPLIFVDLAETELAPPTMCEGAPPIQVIAGDSARVISATIPNRIRSEASTSGDIVGLIPAGDEFIVRDGPTCAEGYTWFLIDYRGTVGWTVEGRGNQYFIEPISDLP